MTSSFVRGEQRRLPRPLLGGSRDARFPACLSGARQRCLDERIDVPVEDTRGIADLEAGAVVLHEGVRVQHVRADLAAPVGGAELAALPRLRLLLLADLSLEQPRAEDLHGRLAVLELRAFVLACDDYPGRQVGGEYRCRRLVIVL